MAESPEKKDDDPEHLFSGLLNNEKFSDAKFIVGEEEKEFIAHRCVLAHRSPVFQTMFLSNMREAYSPDDIRVEDVTVDAFDFILRYMYTGQASELQVSRIPDILYAARKYELKAAEEVCTEFLSKNLAIDNVLEALAGLYGTFDEAAEICLEFVLVNIQTILADPKKTGFVKLSAQCVDEILSKPFYVEHELTVYNALLQWYKYDEDNRQKHMRIVPGRRKGYGLISRVRFIDMDFVEIINKVKSDGWLSSASIEKVLVLKCDKNGDPSGFLSRMRPKANHPNPISQWKKEDFEKWLRNGIPDFRFNQVRRQTPFNPQRLACMGGFYIQWVLRNNSSIKFKALPKLAIAFNSEFADQIHLRRGARVRCSFGTTGVNRYVVKDINGKRVRFWESFTYYRGEPIERYEDSLSARQICACGECALNGDQKYYDTA
eukprot:195083_1